MAGKKGSSGGIAVVVFAAIVLFNILRGSGHSWTYAPFLIVGAVVIVFAVNAIRTQSRRRVEEQEERYDRIARESSGDYPGSAGTPGTTGTAGSTERATPDAPAYSPLPPSMPSPEPSMPEPSMPEPSMPEPSMPEPSMPASMPSTSPVSEPRPEPVRSPTPGPTPGPAPTSSSIPTPPAGPSGQAGELPAALVEKVTALQRSGRTVEAINELREATGMELYAASQYVRKLGKPPLDTD